MGYRDRVGISVLVGQTLSDVTGAQEQNDEIRFFTKDGKSYLMHHDQDCCEHVYIESVVGDIVDIIDEPIIFAEEVSNTDEPPVSDYAKSYTWTFYRIATSKGGITIRWYGSSNGYYSESVNFEEVK